MEEQIWNAFIIQNNSQFSDLVNKCKINLNDFNKDKLEKIALQASDILLEKLKERRDKFLSNLYRSRIEQKLLNYNQQNKKQIFITEQSLFYCNYCNKLMTLSQSQRISCLDQNQSNIFLNAIQQANEEGNLSKKNLKNINIESFTKSVKYIDANGNLNSPHSFSEINLILNQQQKYHDRFDQNRYSFLNSSQQSANNSKSNKESQNQNEQIEQSNTKNIWVISIQQAQTIQRPLEISQFIRFFREKYRLCWKEIYLKLLVVSIFYQPEQCSECNLWFRLADLSKCKSLNCQQDIKFHQINTKTSLNGLNEQDLHFLKSQIQVIDDALTQKEIETLIEPFKQQINFIEPQSLNFDQKLSQAYLAFQQSQDKRNELKNSKDLNHNLSQDRQLNQKDGTSQSIFQNKKELEICEDNFEDLLFECSQGQKKIYFQLKNKNKNLTETYDHILGDSETLKKIQREAKAYVREHPVQLNQNQSSSVIDQGFNQYTNYNNDQNEGQIKKKMSPRSIQRVNKIVQKRIQEVRRDIIIEDDYNAIQILIRQLKSQREKKQNDNTQQEGQTFSQKANSLADRILEQTTAKKYFQQIDFAEEKLKKAELLTEKINKSSILGPEQKQQIKNSGLAKNGEEKQKIKIMTDISQVITSKKKNNKKAAQSQNNLNILNHSKPPPNPNYNSKGEKTQEVQKQQEIQHPILSQRQAIQNNGWSQNLNNLAQQPQIQETQKLQEKHLIIKGSINLELPKSQGEKNQSSSLFNRSNSISQQTQGVQIRSNSLSESGAANMQIVQQQEYQFGLGNLKRSESNQPSASTTESTNNRQKSTNNISNTQKQISKPKLIIQQSSRFNNNENNQNQNNQAIASLQNFQIVRKNIQKENNSSLNVFGSSSLNLPGITGLKNQSNIILLNNNSISLGGIQYKNISQNGRNSNINQVNQNPTQQSQQYTQFITPYQQYIQQKQPQSAGNKTNTLMNQQQINQNFQKQLDTLTTEKIQNRFNGNNILSSQKAERKSPHVQNLSNLLSCRQNKNIIQSNHIQQKS